MATKPTTAKGTITRKTVAKRVGQKITTSVSPEGKPKARRVPVPVHAVTTTNLQGHDEGRDARIARFMPHFAPQQRAVMSLQGRQFGETPSGSLYEYLFQARPSERINLIREGVPARTIVWVSEEMGVTKESLYNALHFSRATVNRRIKNDKALSTEDSERLIGLQKLIGQVKVMVTESGNTEGFNAAHWVAEWLNEPNPALGQAKPVDFMDTIEGQALVSSLLAQMQSGAYA
jgi:putative toxin-antitoxin system antitoxin component (TIGR02293 family)